MMNLLCVRIVIVTLLKYVIPISILARQPTAVGSHHIRPEEDMLSEKMQDRLVLGCLVSRLSVLNLGTWYVLSDSHWMNLARPRRSRIGRH